MQILKGLYQKNVFDAALIYVSFHLYTALFIQATLRTIENHYPVGFFCILPASYHIWYEIDADRYVHC